MAQSNDKPPHRVVVSSERGWTAELPGEWSDETIALGLHEMLERGYAELVFDEDGLPRMGQDGPVLRLTEAGYRAGKAAGREEA